tara:strand:+ start:6392 stop:7291 length:900 start_codon:yes stop_codon:yes gene_type:complete
MRIVLIDADLIVYEAAFCVAKKEKEGVYLNWYQVSKIVNTIVRGILRGSKATHHIGFLTEGKSNFRNKVATTLPYKGQRKTNAEKPHFYNEIRDYLQKHFGFQMMRGVEADDALTIASEYFKDNPKVTTVIATKDKDLWQYAGEHYNMNTKSLMTITPDEGYRHLWEQVLLGDMGTDNIPGLSHSGKWEILFRDEEARKKHRPIPCHSFGKVTVNKILDSMEPKDYPRVILEHYLAAYGIENEADDDFGEQRFYETFTLVYMLLVAPKDLKIHYTPIRVKPSDIAFDGDYDGFRPDLEF